MRYRKRGRPSQAKPDKDLGTNELQAKRQSGQTEEILDRFYRLELVSEKQYWAGNHFRWLYAMRFGIPNVRATDWCGNSGMVVSDDSEAWSSQINHQYKLAEQTLQNQKLLQPALDVLIYSHCTYSYLPPVYIAPDVVDALDILVDLWC